MAHSGGASHHQASSDPDDAMSISLSTIDQSTAAPSPPPPSYRFFLSSHASPSIFSVNVPAPPVPESWTAALPAPVKLDVGGGAPSSAGIQRSVGAWVGSGEKKLWVLAVARKDASVDVILPPSSAQHTESGPSTSSDVAVRLASVKEDRMRVGMERWVGLAIGSSGIYSCTSSGAFRFVPLAVLSTSPPSLAVGEPRTLSLPGPLQHLAFHYGAGPSSSSDPTHFAFGGEEVPLSMYDITSALFTNGVSGQENDNDDEENSTPTAAAAHNDGLTSKQRKRKRIAETRAKNKELNQGEIWRAKNLPNDALSLPQRANITSVVFLPPTDPSTADATKEDNLPDVRILTGTKDGKVRIYEPRSGVRKHRSEAEVAEKGKGPVKVALGVASVWRSTEGEEAQDEKREDQDEVLFADASGRLGVYDTREGKMRFTYKDITGAITSAVLLPPPIVEGSSSSLSRSSPPLVLSASLDSLLRLHSLSTLPRPRSSRTPIPARATGRHTPRKAGQTLLSFLSGTGTAGVGNVGGIVWDGVRPTVKDDAEAGGAAGGRGKKGRGGEEEEEESADDEDEGEDEVWTAMKTVGDDEEDEARARSRENKRRKEVV